MPILQVHDIHKTFGKHEVIKGISLSIEQGEVLSIIGSSGSGKTTLLRCLNFLEFAEKGTISVCGKTIYNGEEKKKLTDAQLRNSRLHFGLVFQQFNLFPQYTVLDNIMLAPKLLKRDTDENIKKKALELVERVGLIEKKDFYPGMLSGGQQQRVAIARALALEPDVLCFDEPTSALDPELTGEVLKVIRSLKDTGSTMIVVTHEMQFAKEVSDKVIFMANGIVEEQGSPSDVFDNPESERLRSFLANAL